MLGWTRIYGYLDIHLLGQYSIFNLGFVYLFIYLAKCRHTSKLLVLCHIKVNTTRFNQTSWDTKRQNMSNLLENVFFFQ